MPHPCRAVRLPEMSAGWQRGRAVENADIVQPEKAALENVMTIRILAVHPPGEVQQKFLEDTLQEPAISYAVYALVDLVDAPCCPGVHRRIHVAERPFVGGNLPVWMHVPLAQHEDQLPLGEIGVDHRQRNTVECQVPGRVPGILPFVGHRNDVGIVQVAPVAVAAVLATFGRCWSRGITVQPLFDLVEVELLAPEHAGEGLALDSALVLGHVLGAELRVIEGVCLRLA
jgi:hypothetical protein